MEFREPGRIKSILVWFCSVIAAASCGSGQNQPNILSHYNLSLITIKQKGGISYHNGQVLNGIVFSLSATGDTLMKGQYRNGKKEGEFSFYFEDGELQEKRTFVNGKKEGKHLGWYENGKTRFEYHYNNDEFDGAYTDWYPSGQVFRRQNFKNGHEEGRQETWFEGGQVKSNYIIKNGRRYGLSGTKNCVNVADSINR